MSLLNHESLSESTTCICWPTNSVTLFHSWHRGDKERSESVGSGNGVAKRQSYLFGMPMAKQIRVPVYTPLFY